MYCANAFHDYLVQCPTGIQVNLVAEAGPYSALRWLIVDKFDNEYTGTVVTNGNGGFTIPVDELPAGLLNPHAGQFTLQVLDTDHDDKVVPIIVAGYFDAITFEVKSGTRVKDTLGVEVECAGVTGGGSGQGYSETYEGDGTTTVFNTAVAFTPGSEQVHVGGLLYGYDEYSVTGSDEITFVDAPGDGVEIRIEY